MILFKVILQTGRLIKRDSKVFIRLADCKKHIALILFLALVPNLVHADEKPFAIKQIETNNELSQAWITAITQDFLGFIWLGTSDGLYRYDGYEFRSYRSLAGDKTTLSGNNITRIFEDSKNNLWIATTKGISLYDRNYDRFINGKSWRRENFTDIIEDNEGTIYFGSFAGFFQYNAQDDSFIHHIQYKDSSDFHYGIQELYVTNSHEIILNGPVGISIFDSKQKVFSEIIPLPVEKDGNAITVTLILQDNKNTFWIGTRDYGLYYWGGKEDETLHRLALSNQHFLIKGTVLSLLESSDSVLWMGTENHGLVLLDLKKFYNNRQELIHITNDYSESSLSNNSIYSLFEDNQKNIWIGTYNGLDFYNSIYSNFQHYMLISEIDKNLSNNIVNTFCEDENRIWIGTEKGVSIIDRPDKSFTYFNQLKYPATLRSDAVWAITNDVQRNFWIGTWANGLGRYNPQTGAFTHYTASDQEQNTISSNNIFSLVTDKEGILWIGTMGGGLNRYDPSTSIFTVYAHDNNDPASLSNDWIRQIFVDSKERFWVSTYDALDLMDRKSETFYGFYPDESDPKSISDDGAIVIFEDSKENIWLGTESGLNLFNSADSGFSYYLEEDGLPSNVIQAILEDDNGNLWISTNNGISKFIDGIHLPEKPEFKNFDARDGLKGNKFNRRSSLKTSDGLLYFGGKNGFISFNPEAIESDTNIPPVVITEVLVFNKFEIGPDSDVAFVENHISLADEIQLKYNYSVFTIKFAALNYLIPEKNQYAYMLEGFEESWNFVGNRRTATYTNLDPGKYIFRIRASNSSDVWNTEGKSLKITILPPWYRTFWAYLGYFIIISTVILIFRKFIVARTQLQHQLVLKNVEKEHMDQVNKMKTRFFTNISHEFRTPLTLIISPLESLLSDINIKPVIKQQLNLIQQNARRLLRLINQLLDISQIESDHLRLKVSQGDIVNYIKEIVTLFRWPAVQRNIQYQFTSDKDSYFAFFDNDKIEKICYNLIANAFKYTPDEGRIEVDITIGDKDISNLNGYLKLMVGDSGVGIRKEEQEKIFEHFYRSEITKNLEESGFGIGLAIVKGLVDAYRGKIEINSEEGRGTQFIIHLPIEREFFRDQEVDTKVKEEKSVTLDIYDLEQGLMESSQAHIVEEKPLAVQM
ncbi:Sensor histidine kinase RcsC [subsurface metagenome]